MNAMYKRAMNMFADASCYAPADQSACSASYTARTLRLDTAAVAVSFLSLAVRISILRLARIILPNRQS